MDEVNVKDEFENKSESYLFPHTDDFVSNKLTELSIDDFKWIDVSNLISSNENIDDDFEWIDISSLAPYKINENSTIYKIDENQLNQERTEYLEKKITPILLSLIKTEDFEFGRKSESVKLVEEQLNFNKLATYNWFNSLYVKNFANERRLIGLLRIVEYLGGETLSPVGETMALAALSHKNDEIKELGVRIFENRCSLESYQVLKSIKVDAVWLQNYINQVIEDLEEELCLS